jgi:acetyltransferase
MNKFERLFEPHSIAVIGVSDDAARPGSQTVRALLKNGYAGSIFPINPKYESFEGLKCYRSISDVEHSIDVVVIGIPAQGALAVLEDAAKKKVPFAVILSGGFRETGPEGIAREQKMLAIARGAGMRIIGPNCLGFANIRRNVYAAFGSITREPKLKSGAVSLVTQSGGFGYSIALGCAEAGIGFRHVIATGNESDIDTVQLIHALAEDPGTGVIVAYIEGARDGRALLEAGRRALAAGKPVLLWKAGVTEQGARAAASHTASMTGRYDFYQAVFKQAGIIEVKEINEVVDFLKALEGGRFPRGAGVAVLGASGGSAIVFADAGEPLGLQLCELSEATRNDLAKIVPSIGAVHNPIDLTAGYFSTANQPKLESALTAVLRDPQVHAVCVNLATTAKAGSLAAAEVVSRVAASTDKPVVIFSSTPVSETADALRVLDEAKVPVLRSPARAAKAIAMLLRYGEARAAAKAAGAEQEGGSAAKAVMALRRLEQSSGALSETASKSILAAAGIPVTRDVVVKEVDGSVFDRLQAPLVVKIVSRDIPHKTGIGGVKVGIGTRSDLEAAIGEVLANGRTGAPQARIEGVLVTEMLRGGFELIAGVVNDAIFGPVVVVGAGGIYAELLRDTACKLAPFDEQSARGMLDELKCRPILDGVRGSAPLDVSAAAKALSALSRFAWESRQWVREIDVNPLFVLPNGVAAADALVVLCDSAKHAATHEAAIHWASTCPPITT